MSTQQTVKPPISVTNLTKYYGSLCAVNQASFEIKKGEIVGFLGPNGAGKSTVLKILTCFMSATSGEVYVAGHNVYTDPLAVRRKVGYQPENVPLYNEMLVYDYLQFMAKMRGVPRAKRSERIDYVVQTCGLKPVIGRAIRELSKGFRQRVGLAQALIHDPEVLILDEPMEGLDPNQIIEIRDLIKDIGREKTVIFSSHILQEIEKIADRILIIDQGRIVANGTIAQMTSGIENRRRYRISLKGSSEQETDLKKELGALASRVQLIPPAAGGPDALSFELTTRDGGDLRPRLFQLAGDRKWELLELREVNLSLEDTFRALTGRDKLQSEAS
ncbi:MAG: ATP-binding cassette domain-containing protein [Bradymonadales bacterium]|nr:ATP-binding cassette domain-containing protein [Bradymonadales bacterium]